MRRASQYKPNRKKEVREVTFERTGDEVWLELECGHFIRKNSKKKWGDGFDCDACIAAGALN